MANILEMLSQQIDKGNDLITRDGDFTAREKVVKTAKNDYMRGLKDESIPFDKSYPEYEKEVIENYHESTEIFNTLESIINGTLVIEDSEQNEDSGEDEENCNNF